MDYPIISCHVILYRMVPYNIIPSSTFFYSTVEMCRIALHCNRCQASIELAQPRTSQRAHIQDCLDVKCCLYCLLGEVTQWCLHVNHIIWHHAAWSNVRLHGNVRLLHNSMIPMRYSRAKGKHDRIGIILTCKKPQKWEILCDVSAIHCVSIDDIGITGSRVQDLFHSRLYHFIQGQRLRTKILESCAVQRPL